MNYTKYGLWLELRHILKNIEITKREGKKVHYITNEYAAWLLKELGGLASVW